MATDEVSVHEADAANEDTPPTTPPTTVSAFHPSLRKLWPRLILRLYVTGELLKYEGDYWNEPD